MFMRITCCCLLLAMCFAGARSAQAVSWIDGGPDKYWTTTANWQFGANPYLNPVTIGNHIDAHNDTTLVDQFYELDSLELTNGADVVLSPDGGTTGSVLQVHGSVTLASSDTTSESFITLYDAPGLSPSLSADSMTIGWRSRVRLDSGSDASPELAILDIDDGLLNITAGITGGIYGNGQIRLLDSVGIIPTTLMRNDGVITAGYNGGLVIGAPPATTLQITASDSGARFDWDGMFEAGTLQVNGNSTLDIDVRTGEGLASDAFDGFINLNTGSTLDVAHTWTFGKSGVSGNGEMNVNTPSYVFTPGQDPNPGPAARIAGANWAMAGGTINIDDSWDTLQLDSHLAASAGTINNSGTLVINDGASFQSAVDFNMIGNGAALVINSGVNIATPDFNLDGVGQIGNLTTINSGGVLNLGLGAGADEDFDHTINMMGGQLQVATLDNDWSLAPAGNVNVGGGMLSLIDGETFHVEGDVNVTGNSTLLVDAVTVYQSNANVVVEAGSTLDHTVVSYDGGSYTGNGILRKGDAIILDDTTWDVATVDFDDGTTAINEAATLVVNADSIDDAGDGIDANISIASTGVLTFNLSGGAPVVVDPAGSINYTGTGVTRTFLTGSDITMNGTLGVHGDGRSEARLDIGGTVAITHTGFDRPFRLAGGTLANPNTLNGGSINGNSGGPNGPGMLSAEDGIALHGFGTINVEVDFADNSHLIATGGVLSLNEQLLDVGTLGTSGSTASLFVNVHWNTNVTDQVLLQNGTLHGSGAITNDGVNGIDGFGEVKSQIINNSRLSANGGTMIYSNLANDWDGSSGTGQIVADNGNIELRGNSQASFAGTMQVDSGREAYTNGFGLFHLLGSNLQLTEASYRSTHATSLAGSTTVNAGSDSTLQMDTSGTFVNGSNLSLLGNLRLDGPNFQLEDGVTLFGGGSLINNAGSKLELFPTAAVDVLLENAGTLGISGQTVGQTTGLDFEQAASGIWEVDLGGTALTDFDSMQLTGSALLNGELDLSLVTGFTPQLGDTFDILSATGGVTGQFTSISQPTTMPVYLMFDVNYLGSIVQLEVVDIPPFTADFDLDGDVDGADLNEWEKAYGVLGADADGDGDSDGIDFLAWQRQFGSGLKQVASASSAVPEPTGMLLASLALACSALTRRRK